MSTIFWPRDVFNDGYFYGWIKHHSVCVAGILNTNTVSRAHLDPFVLLTPVSEPTPTPPSRMLFDRMISETFLLRAGCPPSLDTPLSRRPTR